MLLDPTNTSHMSSTSHTVIEETTTMTTRELYTMCEDSWQRGYDAAHTEQDMEHNQSMKKYRMRDSKKVPNVF